MQVMPTATTLSPRRSRCPISIGLGIASNILAGRLRKPEAAGIVDRRADPADARRSLYGLSAEVTGLALVLVPALVELIAWSARHETSDAPAPVLRATRTNGEAFIAGACERWLGVTA